MENAHMDKIAGIVLAGGQSSRMGRNKALMDFHGQPLVEHMMLLLGSCGIRDAFISGTLTSYPCLPDKAPFSGPAAAMVDCLNDLHNDYDGVLFVPVDMPFLTQDLLQQLMQQKRTNCFENRFLPAYVKTGKIEKGVESVQQLLKILDVDFISAPENSEKAFTNINTPQKWKEVV